MKKLLALILVICSCLATCALLVSCGGGGNPYQAYPKNHGDRAATIDVIKGTTNPETVTEYYKLYGNFSVNTKGAYYITVKEISRTPRNNTAGTTDYQTSIDLIMSYNIRKGNWKVYVYNYSYMTNSVDNDKTNKYEWADNYVYEPARDANASLPLTVFEFDINKYFENGKLTAEDAVTALEFDESYMKDYDSYLKNNPDWKWDEVAIEDIMNAVNATLAEVDKILEIK